MSLSHLTYLYFESKPPIWLAILFNNIPSPLWYHFGSLLSLLHFITSPSSSTLGSFSVIFQLCSSCFLLNVMVKFSPWFSKPARISWYVATASDMNYVCSTPVPCYGKADMPHHSPYQIYILWVFFFISYLDAYFVLLEHFLKPVFALRLISCPIPSVETFVHFLVWLSLKLKS